MERSEGLFHPTSKNSVLSKMLYINNIYVL